MNLVAVVMCGGSGSRLWPLSRNNYPKQFVPLFAEAKSKTLFRCTMDRIAQFACKSVVVVCNQAHRFFVADGLSEAERAACTILVEPEQRNTAAAVTLAALEACRQFDDAMLLIMPSDHVIADVKSFTRAVEVATPAAQNNQIIVFGITPTHAETNYGYIHIENDADNKAKTKTNASFKVTEFCEKPDLDTATKWISRGSCYWNSGIFLVKASVYLDAVAKFEPGIRQSCEQSFEHRYDDLGFTYAQTESFSKCRNISIDYAVMERADNLVLVPADMGWSDLGDWNTLAEVFPEDQHNNRLHGEVVAKHATHNIVHAHDKLVSLLGVDNCIVVDTPDAVLVAGRDHAPQIKDLVADMHGKYPQVDAHRKVFRPWGYYEVLNKAENFQVKRIMINPGQSLSLQMHNHRSEHWVIVKGKAQVTKGDEVFTLTENQSTYIAAKVKHRLENIYDEPVRLIEVQCGDYLEEDDIVRFDDRYGRNETE